jgi:hypothetical protein
MVQETRCGCGLVGDDDKFACFWGAVLRFHPSLVVGADL